MAKQTLVEITYDRAKLDRIRRQLSGIPGAMPRVMSEAINRTATSARAEIVRRLAGEINASQTSIRRVIRIQKARRSHWVATIDLFSKRIPLIKFGAARLKKGVSYQILSSTGRKQIVGDPAEVFIQTLPSGHKGVWRRVGSALLRGKGAKKARGGMMARLSKKRKSKIGRLPIIELLGPSMGHVFESAPGIAWQVRQEASLRLERNIDQQVTYILEKWRAAGRASA